MDDNKKNSTKGLIKTMMLKCIKIVLIPMMILIALATCFSFITEQIGVYKENDKSNVPYAVSTYTSGTTIDEDGTIRTGKTAEELWDEMIKNGSDVNKYLDNPKQLAKLMKAEMVTQYPDTRKDPDKETDWKDIIENEDQIQGIVKFKRTDENNQTSTMSYVSPDTLQGYIDEYNSTGSESAKQNALKHFSLRKSTISIPTTGNNGGGSSGDNVDESKLFFVGDSWIKRLELSGVAKSQYFYGIEGASARWDDMAPSKVIEEIDKKSDFSAIVLYLGVNGMDTYDQMNILINRLANKYSNKTIYVLQVAHVDPNKYTAGFANNSGIDNYNEKVKAHCEQVSNAKFLEVASSVQDSNGLLKNTTDGLHLDDSHDWYNSIISAINGNGGGTTSPGTTESQGPKNTEVDGDGYTHEYTSSAGITYKCFKQGQGSYSTQRYWSDNPNGTISSSGCGPTSVAILASGLLKNQNITPAETAKSMYERHRNYK